jgi:DNA-binding CsgD family transcriptional regulator
MLPADLIDFTGRSRELAAITECANATARRPGLVVVTGAGGMGKSALVVRAGHQLEEVFPDAHLYADLHGYSGGPVAAARVLQRFLRTLGVAGSLPDDQEELAGLFRIELAGRRCLVVLDDAANEAQVRPLLPPGPDALTLITSRNWLGGLSGATVVQLGPVTESEGRSLLDKLLDDERAADPAIEHLLALCGHLPLAIHVAASRLRARPLLSVRDMCERLRDEGRRLHQLAAGDTAVNSVLASSYEALDEADQAVFRRLGLLPGADFTADEAMIAAGVSYGDAQDALDRMADQSIVLAEAAPCRYSLNPLTRLFAMDMLTAHEAESAVRGAGKRLTEWLLGQLDAAALLVSPCIVRLPHELYPIEAPFADRNAAMAWLDASHRKLLTLAEHRWAAGDAATCWTIADALRGYYSERRYREDWMRSANTGLRAATEAGDVRARAAMHLSAGMACLAAAGYQQSEQHLQEAVGLCLSSTWQEGEAAAYYNLAAVARANGDRAVSEKYLAQWTEVNQALGPPPAARGDAGGHGPASDAASPMPDWTVLSNREQTVARLVVYGLTNQQIARRIRCSPETVKFHLRNIFRKLGITSRVEIARYVLIRRGSSLSAA